MGGLNVRGRVLFLSNRDFGRAGVVRQMRYRFGSNMCCSLNSLKEVI